MSVARKMLALGTKKSTIREIFEYGKRREQEVGVENVFDFSLGNPNAPLPPFIQKAAVDLLQADQGAHGYTIAPGAPQVRAALAQSLSAHFPTPLTARNLFMTAGAAAALTISFKALAEAGDEFLVIAPYFPEYLCFLESVGAKPVIVPPKPDDFQIDLEAMAELLNEKTKAVIINSPNNPSGAVYSEKTLRALAQLLNERQKQYDHPIYLISDEPYREIVYDGACVPDVPKLYANTIICYSYSKSYSLAGERIGYIALPNELADFDEVLGAVAGAARVLTHVNAPVLWQKVIARCAGMPTNISLYEKNRRLLYDGLCQAGFTCTLPQGAFYLFPKALEADDRAFCKKAQAFDLLFVPGSDFGCAGYFRASYCIATKQIERSLPALEKLAATYRG